MNPQTTLEAVRELSERAMLRPAPLRLRLTRPAERNAGPRPAPTTWEELHPPTIGGDLGTAGNHKSRRPRAVGHCPACGKRAEYCYCDVGPKKDFLQLALEKAEAATERRPVVLPPAA